MNMKTLAVGMCASVLILGQAFAADLPNRKVPPEYIPPAFTWTGWHIGVTGGYAGGTVNTTSVWSLPVGFSTSNSFGTSGFTVGVENGYLWQLSNNVVVGYEADYQYADVRGRDQIGFGDSRQRLEWLGTERLRVGYAFGRILPYFTGGFAYGRVRAEGSQIVGGYYFPIASAQTNIGWTVGAGVEYAFWNNWSVKAEYLYTELRGPSGQAWGLPLTATALPGYKTYYTPTFGTHVARVGVNVTLDIMKYLGLPAIPRL